MFMFPQKNLARKGLTPTMVLQGLKPENSKCDEHATKMEAEL